MPAPRVDRRDIRRLRDRARSEGVATDHSSRADDDQPHLLLGAVI